MNSTAVHMHGHVSSRRHGRGADHVEPSILNLWRKDRCHGLCLQSTWLYIQAVLWNLWTI